MKIELVNKVLELSKNKKDGIYKKDGYCYLVRNNYPEIFINRTSGKGYKLCGNFTVDIGNIETYNIEKTLKKILKNNERS